jgi:magnesium-dependent phosphatase 1
LFIFFLAIASQSILASSFVVNVSVPSKQQCRHRPTIRNNMNLYPDLVVYDLDACFWDKEMFEMPSVPSENDVVRGDLNGRGEGVMGVMSGSRHRISLHKGALQSLQEHADGVLYPGMRVAFASSADTVFAERVGRASLKLLEVVPGLTVWDLVVGRDWKGVDVNQIGRQPPLLSSNKAKSHFPRLREVTGIRYDRMLFFDDCNWGDHCRMVAEGCKEVDTGAGPATVRTPYGLGLKEWKLGLEVYAKHANKLMEQTSSD